MKSWSGYWDHFQDKFRSLTLSIPELVLLVSLLLMCAVSGYSSLSGRDVGQVEALKMAKMQPQQELMALRMSHGH